ncbi:hypothetical protein EE612_012927 [Oryza sativa]|nr:hypothetical protein EE612_012927 [Oryza sativa]
MARAATVAAASSALLLALLLALAWGAAAGAGEVPLGWELGVGVGGGSGDDDGFGFSGAAADGAAVVRRVLQGRGYISYGALRRDTTPLLRPRRLLLQLPPRRPGQPLLPRLLRHHPLPRLTGLHHHQPAVRTGFKVRSLLLSVYSLVRLLHFFLPFLTLFLRPVFNRERRSTIGLDRCPGIESSE